MKLHVFPFFSTLAAKEGNFKSNHNSYFYLHLYFAAMLNMRKLWSPSVKQKIIDAKGTHVLPQLWRRRGIHLSHWGKANTITQPYIQMGLCRVRPVTVLRTVGEIELSAQRLDLEGKHSEPLCDSGKSRTLVKHKNSWYLQNEQWPRPS